MNELYNELIYILANTDIELTPVEESILIPVYNINNYEISKEAYFYVMDLIKNDLRNRKIIADC